MDEASLNDDLPAERLVEHQREGRLGQTRILLKGLSEEVLCYSVAFGLVL